jgi:hypothetical protein
MQRYRGNRYTGNVLQAMRVSSPGDRLEREADRAADQIVAPAAAGSAAVVPASRGPAGIQRSADGPGGGAGAPVQQAISSARGGGRPLPAPVRGPLERSLGDDFSAVRVHTDAGADRLARGMGAVAFTTGPDIFFRRGRYDPGVQSGRRLLAHELTHVVQQRGLTAPPIQRKMGLEYETDDIDTRHTRNWSVRIGKTWEPHDAGDRLMGRGDYEIGADTATGTVTPRSRVEFRTRAFDETKPAEVGLMIAAVRSILADIHAIRQVSRQHAQPGWGAKNPWVFGGERGWFAYSEWVGLNEIPRLRGPWWQQVLYTGRFSKDLVGSLQLTGGFSLAALDRLISGRELGSIDSWPPTARSEPRQYLHGYARQGQEPPELYRAARIAVLRRNLSRGGGAGSAGKMAAILSVMAQVPLSQRSARYDVGNMLAKTDYAKLFSMARADGMQFTPGALLQGLLDVVNSHLDPTHHVHGGSPVIPDTGPPDLTKVSLLQWVYSLVPPPGPAAAPVDLITKASYPGTPAEKGALRAFGPYRHTDPGALPGDPERAIFELRSIMASHSADLLDLVNALVLLMQALNRAG